MIVLTKLKAYLEGLRGKRILVLGLGVSNRPLVRLLLQHGLDVTGCDKAPAPDEERKALERQGAKLHLGPDYLKDLAADVIFRYFHLAEIGKIPAGENAITKDTILGRYGGSGMGSKSYWSPHLHVEADTDVRYPRYSPTFTPSGEILFGRAAGATAATLRDCLDYLYRKTSAPDRQTYQTAGAPYVDQKDFAIPVLPE